MTTIKKWALSTAVFCFSLMLTVSCSNDKTTEDSTEHAEEMNDENLPKETEKDADRMVELAGTNTYEIQASQEASTRATTSEVKKIAAMMVEAHTKMGTEMAQLAAKKGITLPTDLPNEKMNDLNRLKEKSGIDYDREYLDQMKNAHEEAVRKLDNLAEKGEDAEVRDLAAKSVSEVRSHLDMIEATRNSVKDMKSDARKADNNSNRSTAGHDDHDGHQH